MSASDWLSRLDPGTPENLATAMRSAVSEFESTRGEAVGGDAPSPDRLFDAAELLMRRVLEKECATRDSALDLLTVDALVTRAVQIAGRDPGTLEDFPKRAMARVATLVRANQFR